MRVEDCIFTDDKGFRSAVDDVQFRLSRDSTKDSDHTQLLPVSPVKTFQKQYNVI